MIWRLLRWFLLAVVLIVAGLLAWLYVMQDRMLYPGADAVEPFGELRIARGDIGLRGWIVHPQATDALVVFGGNGMSLSAFAPRLAACSDRAIYLVPYRGYEGQAGAPRERTMVADGIALVGEAQAKHARVAILGISLGTGIATQVAVSTRPDRLVLVTPYDSMVAVAADRFHGAPLGWLMHDRYESGKAAARLRDVPVHVLQALNDEVIPASSTERLVRDLPVPPVKWDKVMAGHNTILRSDAFCEALRF